MYNYNVVVFIFVKKIQFFNENPNIFNAYFFGNTND
jgi:hypothetical protein